MSIGVLVDAMSYAKTNCFIHQLLSSISDTGEKVEFYDWRWLRRSNLVKNYKSNSLRKHDFIIVICRQRVINQEFLRILEFLGEVPVVIYDQDPWNAYWDNYNTKGIYRNLIDNLNVIKFAVPSLFWAEYIAKKESIRTDFVRMGMLPKYCSTGLSLAERSPGLSFKGTLYDYRVATFNFLESQGIKIKIEIGNLDYRNFLAYLSNISIFFHDESAPLFFDGNPVPRNMGMWHKDIEVASRGCFVIRDFSVESEAYEIDSIPTILLYKDLNEIPNLIARIQSFTHEESKMLQIKAVNQIKDRNDWSATANSLVYPFAI